MSERRFRVAVAVAYTGIGLAVFAPILRNGFVSDDWEFLWIVSQAKSVLVCFQPLVGRFVRPWVVLTYYANYKAFGLWTLPYHLTLVLLHVFNAWLVCLLAERVAATRSRITGASAGLIFLVFAGHTEAVSWVAGVADPAVLPFLIGGLLTMDRALASARPAKSMAAGWLLYAGAMLAKETSVIFPLLALALGVFRTAHAADRRRAAIRTIVFVSVPGALVTAYVLMRAVVFGSPLGAYGGLGTSGGMFFGQARAFLLRAFLPPLPQRAVLWFPHIDVALVALGIASMAALVIARRRDRGALLFSVAATIIALAPALPLTISLVTTESERYVYVASAFSSIVLAIAFITTRRAALGLSVLACLVAAHVLFLERSHRTWREAATVFDAFVRSFALTLEQRSPGSQALAIILNLPDNVRGAYVCRNGLGAAIRIRYPHVSAWIDRTRIVASHGLSTARDRVIVKSVARHGYFVDITPNRFLQAAAPATVHYTFSHWDPNRYTVQLEPNVWSAVVVATSEGRAQLVDEFAGEGAPFGVVDIPADGAACAGESLRFSGWALDNEEVRTVEILRDAFPGAAAGRGDARVRVATATWAVGTRPDIEAAYKGLPHVERAEWNYYLPCAMVAAAPGHALRVHVIAADDDGFRTEIGVRTVRGR